MYEFCCLYIMADGGLICIFLNFKIYLGLLDYCDIILLSHKPEKCYDFSDRCLAILLFSSQPILLATILYVFNLPVSFTAP